MDARSANDSSWVRNLFKGELEGRDERFLALRRYSNGMMSFEDTTMGGSKAINSPPQFTWFADPPSTGAFARPGNREAEKKALANGMPTASYRLGTYYYESINQNSFYVHCRFGKPKYLGMAAFFANMYDSNLAYLARTGDYPGMIRTIASYIGAAAIWATVGTVAFAVILITPRILAAALNKQTSRYYYVKPTMHLYLRAVQNILNTQLVYRRLVPTGILGTFQVSQDGDGKGNKKARDDAFEALPEVWKKDGEFDVFKMINRYQTLANYQNQRLKELRKQSSSDDDFAERIRNFYLDSTYGAASYSDDVRNYEVSLQDMERLAASERGGYAAKDASGKDINSVDELEKGVLDAFSSGLQTGGTASDLEAQAAEIQNKMNEDLENADASNLTEGQQNTIQSWADKGKESTMETFFGDFVKVVGEQIEGIKAQALSEIYNGSQWVTWRIDGKDTVSRSFSNSTKEPEISSTVNSMTAKARQLEVNLSGGQTGFNAVDSLITGFKSVMRGLADTLHLTGIMSLYNSSVIDFPEVWDSSDASGDDINLTIPLRAWSGSDLDIFQEILVPLSFWIAAVCPIATGKQSFTHPFYLECYSQGRFSFRNAIVTSLSLQFGVGGLGWRPGDSVPLSCDINVTIRDLSRVMYMPIVTDTGVWDDDNKFSEFMACLGAATLYERTNGIERAKIQGSIWAQNWASAWSQGSFINSAFDVLPARQIANIFLPQAR